MGTENLKKRASTKKRQRGKMLRAEVQQKDPVSSLLFNIRTGSPGH